MGTIKIDGNKIKHQQGGKWVELGDADFANRTFIVYRDRTKHLMRVFNGYGFNKEVIEDDTLFDHVIIEETFGNEKNTYAIPRDEISQEGRLYQAEGYERQVFLSLEQLEKYKV